MPWERVETESWSCRHDRSQHKRRRTGWRGARSNVRAADRGPAAGDRCAPGGDDGDGNGATGRLAGHAHDHRPAQRLRDLSLGRLGLPAGVHRQHSDLREARRPLRPQADLAVRPGLIQRGLDALRNRAKHGSVDRHADRSGPGRRGCWPDRPDLAGRHVHPGRASPHPGTL